MKDKKKNVDPIVDLKRRKIQELLQTNYVVEDKECYSFQGMDPEDPFIDGLHYLEKLDYENAIKFYKDHSNSYPDNLTFLNNLGVAYKVGDDRYAAIKNYKKAIEKNKYYYIGWYNLGAVHYELKKYSEAIDYFDEALKINPNCGEAFYDKIRAQEQQNKYDFGEFVNKMTSGINIARARLNMGNALVDLGNGKDWIIGYSRIFFKDLKILNDLFSKGQEFLQKKDLDKAIKIHEKMIEINPYYPPAYLSKVVVLMMRNDLNEAIKILEYASTLKPGHVEIWEPLGTLYYHNLKKFKDSKKCFREALKIDPLDENLIKYYFSAKQMIKRELFHS